MLTLVQQTTGDIRWGFAFILVSISLQFGGIARMDLLAGAAEAAAAGGGDGGKAGPAADGTDRTAAVPDDVPRLGDDGVRRASTLD